MFKFYEFTMTYGKSFVDQVQDLLILVTKLREVKIIVPESLQVGAIMSKLPNGWNNYRKKLLHMAEDTSLQDLFKGIQIEEETQNREKAFSSQNFTKVNYVEGSSTKFKKNLKVNNTGKFKKTNPNTKSGKKDGNCHHCGKKGHFIRDCRFKKNEEAKLNNANLVEENSTEVIIAMVSKMQIGMITELSMAAATKSSDWWLDSGATIQLCNDKTQFKTYTTE